MKKFTATLLFLFSGAFYQVFAYDNKSHDELTRIKYNERITIISPNSGCMNYYSVTQIDCAGSVTTVHLGGNRGDCQGNPEGSILYHNTTTNACNGEAIGNSVISVISIAATIATIIASIY